MNKYVFAIAVFACSSCFVYASHYPINLDGNYDCYGTDIGTGDAFKCKMRLTKTGKTYAQHANCNDGTSYDGTGIYDQNKHTLAIVSINPKKSEETGVVIVDIKESGAMTSVFTYLNKTTLGRARCSKRKDL